ncbi:uncharacterized protein LOC135156581 isoform X3 [Lytechinus pictus]|uniref:uncharacterized protein LOC135156581 isoform X3 n=2 Tax=Lytechinus pictus TaxID=7653 RepID=UPI0030B9B3B6
MLAASMNLIKQPNFLQIHEICHIRASMQLENWYHMKLHLLVSLCFLSVNFPVTKALPLQHVPSLSQTHDWAQCEFQGFEDYEEVCHTETITLPTCNPGYRRAWSCLPDFDGHPEDFDPIHDVCDRCPPNTFQSFYNKCPVCHNCSVCDEGETVQTQCDMETDTVCSPSDSKQSTSPLTSLGPTVKEMMPPSVDPNSSLQPSITDGMSPDGQTQRTHETDLPIALICLGWREWHFRKKLQDTNNGQQNIQLETRLANGKAPHGSDDKDREERGVSEPLLGGCKNGEAGRASGHASNGRPGHLAGGASGDAPGVASGGASRGTSSTASGSLSGAAFGLPADLDPRCQYDGVYGHPPDDASFHSSNNTSGDDAPGHATADAPYYSPERICGQPIVSASEDCPDGALGQPTAGSSDNPSEGVLGHPDDGAPGHRSDVISGQPSCGTFSHPDEGATSDPSSDHGFDDPLNSATDNQSDSTLEHRSNGACGNHLESTLGHQYNNTSSQPAKSASANLLINSSDHQSDSASESITASVHSACGHQSETASGNVSDNASSLDSASIPHLSDNDSDDQPEGNCGQPTGGATGHSFNSAGDDDRGNDTISARPGIPADDVVTTKFLQHVVQELSHIQIKATCRLLGLQEKDIDNIEALCHRDEQGFEFLKKLLGVVGKDLTYRALLDALKTLKNKHHADNLIRDFNIVL